MLKNFIDTDTTNDGNADPTTSLTPGRPKIKFNENHIYEIRKVIYEMFSKREHVTLTLLQKLKDKHFFEHSRISLYRLMLEIGFKLKKNGNPKVLCEQRLVVILRQKCLREYARVRLMNSNEYTQFVYLDETWIFAKGSFKRSWDDGSDKCVKHTGSEGKRFIVLNAGSRHWVH
jgi:hypothetical protein